MRDLLFKNLTSSDKKRKKISTLEVIEKEGIRSVVRRHFVCVIKELNKEQIIAQNRQCFVLKNSNTKELKESFFCRIKGSIYAVYEQKTYLIQYAQSLRVDLTDSSQNYPRIRD